jgi:two-component system chemotaxis response regulator CheY
MSQKILIVDDSSLSRRNLRQLLESMGHTVSEATDGAQALERFFVDPPALVLLDMVMTGMYGTEVLAKMQEMNPAIPVVVATADVQKSTADQVRAGGAKGLLTKPVNREQLAAMVAKVLGGGDAWN